MPGNKYLVNNAGVITEAISTQSSAGAGDANKIVALDAAGKLDNSMLPSGIGADTQSIQASEALSAGDLVNIHDVTGAFRIRKADAAVTGKTADGFVIAAVSSGTNGTVYFEGNNTAVTALTPGLRYLSSTVPGGTQATPPTGAGKVVQKVGFATQATNLNFNSGEPIVLA